MIRATRSNIRGRLLALFATLALLLTGGDAWAGYTHYWKWLADPDRAALARCVSEMAKIADARRALLAGEGGRTGKDARFETTCPYADAGDVPCVVLNGVGEDAHETFSFPLAAFAGTPAFSFVKTALKPYDVVVVAALIVARDHFGPETLEISSDGNWASEWVAGARLYTQVLGRRARNPMAERGPGELPPLPSGAADPLGSADDEEPGAHRDYAGYVFGVLLVAAIAYIAGKVIRRF